MKKASAREHQAFVPVTPSKVSSQARLSHLPLRKLKPPEPINMSVEAGARDRAKSMLIIA
jgi:hypothetical protein